jgi:hypothetical protein
MSTYQIHPSERLQRLFSDQEFPHQGQDPRTAKVVFVGLDANYSPDITDGHPFFERIIEYHQDSVKFWQKHGAHHPFLLPEYPFKKNTGGVPYHRKFGWMGLTPDYAGQISFIELLDVPTTGRTENDQFWDLFSQEHAKRIDDLVRDRSPRLVMLSRSLTENYMRKAYKKWHFFQWLPGQFQLGEMKRVGETVIYGAPHFSSTQYKKEVFEELGVFIRDFCDRQGA